MAVPQTRGRVTYLVRSKKTAGGKKIIPLNVMLAIYHSRQRGQASRSCRITQRFR